MNPILQTIQKQARAALDESKLDLDGRRDLTAVCRMRCVVTRNVNFDFEVAQTDTLLVPRIGGFIAVFASKAVLNANARRFRLAHEVGHTFFYDMEDPAKTPRRIVPITWEEETFCDLFANAFMVPHAEIHQNRDNISKCIRRSIHRRRVSHD